jgi:hypothetical protein
VAVGHGNGRLATYRVSRTATSIAALRQQVSDWLVERRSDARFVRFRRHFDVLETVLVRMMDALDDELVRRAADPDPAVVYEQCRDLDRSLLYVQRTFRWYAEKYDQRLDDRFTDVLRCADEVVRSCWTEPFEALRQPPPTGPLTYLEPRFDAFATPRVSPPPDLRAPADAIVAGHVRDLPIPTVALPEVAEREPWWLVLAAHETGHHVHKDLLPGLEEDTRGALFAVGAEMADDWSAWALEIFADAYSVLMVGPAAAWPVDELQYAQAAQLLRAPEPGDRYPPPAVRLALLGELARRAGLDERGTSTSPQDMADWIGSLPSGAVSPEARATTLRLLELVPGIAGSLLALPVGTGTLLSLSGARPEWFAPDGRVCHWARRLGAGESSLSPLAQRPAARLAVAAGVASFREISSADRQNGEASKNLAGLRRALLDVLPSCGGPGVLAAAPRTDIDELADRLAAQLVMARPDGERG